MGFFLWASDTAREVVYDSNRNPVALIDEPVRLYRPRDDGAAPMLDVVILTGTFAGLNGRVPRDRVFADQNGYVSTEQELTALAAAMEREVFKDRHQIWRRIPFLAGSMHCWARADAMAELLKTSGYTVKKLILINYGGLEVDSIFGDDLTDPNGATGFTWKWHIAPIVFLGNENRPFVIDPSLLTTAAPADQWMAKMKVTTATPMNYEAMVNRLLLTKRYPVKPETSWLVLAEEDVLEPPPKPNKPQERDDETSRTYVIGALEDSWDSLPQRFAVAALNTLRNNWLAAVAADAGRSASTNPYGEYQANLTDAIGLCNQLNREQRDSLVDDYPELLKAIGLTFIGTGVEADIATLFSILNNQVGAQ
ncbi:protein-glutamine glutaminase family protein [Rugosimonospora africana]|uniref:Protein glutaminase domain-containing protein n=1 Tax=Rugosimonospora africana TaxID=556532 RepID=A0A8J3VQG9_9ACTN|nr:protein-glutamine glutaminase family protein [Rugosimonospora africana]GIH15129.1 hypothetical protein Raf01_33010 [Rugosimonospora africana]